MYWIPVHMSHIVWSSPGDRHKPESSPMPQGEPVEFWEQDWGCGNAVGPSALCRRDSLGQCGLEQRRALATARPVP